MGLSLTTSHYLALRPIFLDGNGNGNGETKGEGKKKSKSKKDKDEEKLPEEYIQKYSDSFKLPSQF